MDIGRVVIILIVVFVGISILQTLMRSLAKVLRWSLSTAFTFACVFLLWKVGAFEWADGVVSGLGIAP